MMRQGNGSNTVISDNWHGYLGLESRIQRWMYTHAPFTAGQENIAKFLAQIKETWPELVVNPGRVSTLINSVNKRRAPAKLRATRPALGEGLNAPPSAIERLRATKVI